MAVRIINGDCRDVLRTLPDENVHCVVTSPPYYGLRDYGVDGQIGLEDTPDAYIAEMVAVFCEVRRVLRSDGVMWLNIGDSYNNRTKVRTSSHQPALNGFDDDNWADRAARGGVRMSNMPGIKEKDLIGIPWALAFALRADGWVLRQEIIWNKPNPMPESVTDRCTKSHEQLFLFSKAQWTGPSPGRFAHISNEDARWIALCIDTEGCIVVKRARQADGGADSFSPQVTFGGTNRALVERFREIVGHGNLSTRPGKNAPMLYWQVANNIARDLLHRIYPYLIVKQRQARIAIYVDDLVYYRGGKLPSRKMRTDAENAVLLSLWARNKECNQFGEPDLSDVPEPKYGRWTSARYHYDAEAIAEAAERAGDIPGGGRAASNEADPRVAFYRPENGAKPVGDTRNRRSVWTIATQPFKEAHFATFPPALVEPCIKAGCPAGGTVLDPFGGAGTVGLVADRLQRDAILIELNPAYADMARQRVTGDAPLLAAMEPIL